jgi:predicted nucleic acid-binding protein
VEIVVDAAVAAAWFLPDEQNDAVDQVLAALQGSPARAPSLFWFEVRSLFVMAEKRGRLKPGEAALSMAQLRALPIVDAGAGADWQVIALAHRHGLSGYDASYLGLAVGEQLPLATLDKKLSTAAHAESLVVLGMANRP